MAAVLAEVGHAWAWLIGGLVLGAGELLAPGIFLIWLGLAALITGAIVAVAEPAWQVQILLFAAFSVAMLPLARRVTRHPVSTLNRRGHDLVGQTVVLATPIVSGVGRVQRGDTSWRISGPDLPTGAAVRIVGIDGTTLVVVPAEIGQSASVSDTLKR